MRDSSIYGTHITSYGRLRERVAAMRQDAKYWRRRGRRETALEVERVAAFVNELAEELVRRLTLG